MDWVGSWEVSWWGCAMKLVLVFCVVCREAGRMAVVLRWAVFLPPVAALYLFYRIRLSYISFIELSWDLCDSDWRSRSELMSLASLPLHYDSYNESPSFGCSSWYWASYDYEIEVSKARSGWLKWSRWLLSLTNSACANWHIYSL